MYLKEKYAMIDARINKIFPFSSVDGPGNRSVIFFQGCGFNCKYCHNPETIQVCKSCGDCISVCPTKALTMSNSSILWDTNLCCACDLCLKQCLHSSSPKTLLMTVSNVFETLKDALPFITGITVSGGECTCQHLFLTSLFQKAHELGKTAFIDTNGQLDFQEMPALTREMDQAMLDIKSTNTEEHFMLTGSDNHTVLKNLHYLASIGKLYEIRTVIVPELLDNFRTVQTAARLIAPFPNVRYKLIRYRPWGVRPGMEHIKSPDTDLMERLGDLAQANGAGSVVTV